MVSDAVSFTVFVVAAVIICAVFAVVVIRSLKGKGCSCGKNKNTCGCCMEHCSFRKK
ncbi:MAG TPA: hypothetical protein O0Y17_02615 [Methanocorpusculum sp.]|nr:hypothetical protein [Methanocorpusculum sp.]